MGLEAFVALQKNFTEYNRLRRHRKAHEKAWKAKIRWEGMAAHGAPQRRRQANELARAARDQKIRKRQEWGRGR